MIFTQIKKDFPRKKETLRNCQKKKKSVVHFTVYQYKMCIHQKHKN